MKKLLFLVAAALAFPAAAQVKIGVINSMSGPAAPIGENLTNGIALAQEDLARRGIRVRLVVEDDAGNPELALRAMEKLATRDKVAGVVGPYTSGSADVVAHVAERHQVPLLVPVAAKEDLTRQGFRYVYRLNAPASQYAAVLLDAVTRLGDPKTIAFVYENTEFGTSTTDTAKAYAATKGLRVVADEPYSKDSPDHRSKLARVKAANPDLVFMVSYVADAILLMRQARELELRPQAFLGGGAGFTTVQFAAEKDISRFVFSATHWSEEVPWPGAKEFGARYRAKFGRRPTYHAACAYQAVMVMADAAAKAAGDRERIRAGLAEGTWSGIMGEVDFTDFDGFTNQNRHQMLVQQILDSRYETIFPEEFATSRATFPFPGWE
jgi:branched-chain amino acid transport system substrate-binding protein